MGVVMWAFRWYVPAQSADANVPSDDVAMLTDDVAMLTVDARMLPTVVPRRIVVVAPDLCVLAEKAIEVDDVVYVMAGGRTLTFGVDERVTYVA